MEQSVFTYCYKRFDEPGGGWGFYSYSNGMEKIFASNPKIKEMAGSDGYEIPRNRDVWLIPKMSDLEKDLEQERVSIETYHPERFAYTNIGDLSVFVHGKNLGRETVNRSRPANKLVYTLAGSVSEVSEYPCFYYGNKNFGKMTRAFFESTDKQLVAPALSQVSLLPQGTITYENVVEFLSEKPERENILTSLFYSLVHEKTGRNRPIIICDNKDNIIFWISAVTLLFPLEIAKIISFSTYEFFGGHSGSFDLPEGIQLCGAYSPTINGAPESDATNYDIRKVEKNEDLVVFDIECGIIPTFKSNAFDRLIHSFCKGDNKELKQFHKYIIEKTTYREFDKTYLSFYPISKEKPELFGFYATNVQSELFFDYYPSLYDLNTKIDIDVMRSLTESAVKSGIITEAEIKKDLDSFTARTFQNKECDFERVAMLAPIFELVGSNAEKIVKTIYVQNIEKWTEYFIKQKGIPVTKLTFLLSLLNPFDRVEAAAIKKLCSVLIKSEVGKKAIASNTEKWLNSGFYTSNPSAEPIVLSFFIQVNGGDNETVRKIAECFFAWEKHYRFKVLDIFENSPYYEDFYVCIKEKVLDDRSDNIDAVVGFIEDCYQNGNKKTFGRLFDSILGAISAVSIYKRKSVFQRLITSSINRTDYRYVEIANSIYNEYQFSNPEELADFSYAYFINILMSNTNDFPFDEIVTILKRFRCSKRAWSKIIESLPVIKFKESYNLEAKRLLTEGIFGGKNQNADEDKPGIEQLKRLFRKKK